MKKEQIKKLYNRVKAWSEKYERVLLPGTMAFGVAVDFLTFKSIQISTAFLILGAHIIFAGIVIAYWNAYDAGLLNKEHRLWGFLRLAAPYAIQFSFGALASASFIFYFFSGSIYVSWPFILIIVILMVGNEVFRKYYLRAGVQVAVYYFLLFSISAIVIPYILQKISPGIFLLSGTLSLLFIFGYIALLSFFIKKISFSFRRFWKQIAAIFLLMNLFYFMNFIPPIPLSLREAVVGQGLERRSGEYHIWAEEESLWEKILPGRTVHRKAGSPVVVYTAIFAPGKMETKIIHNWQHKENGKWVSKSKLSFTAIGGREDGFRGYSLKTSVPAGEWRVDVETTRGQVLGRVRFNVVEVSEMPELVEIIK
ncbi:MAG: DUF2914 domain-containing protein [Patescibacteria group bacterium]